MIIEAEVKDGKIQWPRDLQWVHDNVRVRIEIPDSAVTRTASPNKPSGVPAHNLMAIEKPSQQLRAILAGVLPAPVSKQDFQIHLEVKYQ